MVQLERPGRAQGDGAQRLFHADALGFAQHAALRRDAVDRAPGGKQRPQRRDRGVGMDGQVHPGGQGAGAAVEPVGAVRAHGHLIVLVAPVPQVVGKQIDAQAQRGHAAKQRRVHHLRVLQGVAVVGARRAGQHALNGVDGHLAGLVAIGVGVHQQPGAVVGLKVGLVLRRGSHPNAIGRAVEIARPAQPGAKALDGAVQHHLYQAIAQPVGVACHQGLHVRGAQCRAVRAVKGLKRRQDAHAAVVLRQRCFQGLAVGVAEFVH